MAFEMTPAKMTQLLEAAALLLTSVNEPTIAPELRRDFIAIAQVQATMAQTIAIWIRP